MTERRVEGGSGYDRDLNQDAPLKKLGQVIRVGTCARLAVTFPTYWPDETSLKQTTVTTDGSGVIIHRPVKVMCPRTMGVSYVVLRTTHVNRGAHTQQQRRQRRFPTTMFPHTCDPTSAPASSSTRTTPSEPPSTALSNGVMPVRGQAQSTSELIRRAPSSSWLASSPTPGTADFDTRCRCSDNTLVTASASPRSTEAWSSAARSGGQVVAAASCTPPYPAALVEAGATAEAEKLSSALGVRGVPKILRRGRRRGGGGEGERHEMSRNERECCRP